MVVAIPEASVPFGNEVTRIVRAKNSTLAILGFDIKLIPVEE